MILKEKILKAALYICGALSLVAFISISYKPLFNNLTINTNMYGGLYAFDNIPYFKELRDTAIINQKFKPKNTVLNQADFIIFGDSFFEGYRILLNRAFDELDKSIFFERYNTTGRFPLYAFQEEKYQRDIPKKQQYVILEMTEVLILKELRKKNALSKNFRINIKSSNTEEKYEEFLKHGKYSWQLYGLNSGIKYALFGYRSKGLAVGRNDKDNWLFLEQYDMRKKCYPATCPISDADIEKIAATIDLLKTTLKQQYNLELIFVPVPNSGSIYTRFFSDEAYNNFIPRLYKYLDEKKIRTVKIYHLLKNNDAILYHSADIHWNTQGAQLGIDALRDYLIQEKLVP